MHRLMFTSFARWVKGFGLSLLLILVIAPVASSQTQITTGTIQGTVTDANGAIVPGANVEIKNLDTNFSKTLTTDDGGRFVSLALPPGNYSVTISKQGFATTVVEKVELTVGQALNLPISMKVSGVEERVTITATPVVDTLKTEASTTLNETAVSTTPILGRKFEDLLTLTPGVSVVQGPDGDEITFSGQRGVFNNVSFDGGDYNNGFFGEQLGGQRAAIDIPLDAVKEFQVVATGASAEFGRSAGGVVNVISKSGTNNVHGSLYHFQRLEALTANTSDGKPLTDFHREQFGGTIGGPIVKSKVFYFGAFEQIIANLTRANLSQPIGTPCSVSAPTITANESLINSSDDCARLALIGFMKAKLGQDEGLPVKHPIRNSALLTKLDWTLNSSNQLGLSYNFDYSKNTNQTFDVSTYGTSANGTEGPSKINNVNLNLNTTFSPTKLNEAHFSYSRESRPRSATPSNLHADTAMGFVTTFRFGDPFFLNPKIDELLWRTHLKDNFSIISGRHTWKMGGEWLHTLNDQVFRGFFTGRYIFDSVTGFLKYASTGPGFGPSANAAHLLLFLQGAGRTGPATDAAGASRISNQDYSLFAQDKWQIRPNFTLNYGLRWEAQIFPDVVTPPSQTAYGVFLSNPRFPSDGTLHNQKKEFQPRVGFAWDIRNNQKSVLRASWGIYNGRQNMLSQVGSITTNGVQQSTIFTQSSFGGGPAWPGDFPATPGIASCPGPPVNPFPCFSGVRLFSKHYANPRIYTTNFAYEQEIVPNLTAYADFTWSKGVHLTTFIDGNAGGYFADNGTFVPGGTFSPDLGGLMITASTAKSLYRGLTIGMRKRFSQHFQLEWNYVLSEDLDSDSNERDPFTDRRLVPSAPLREYSFSDRDERHKFNLFSYFEFPGGFNVDARLQAHTPQPITPPGCAAIAGCKRNSSWKNNEYTSFDWR